MYVFHFLKEWCVYELVSVVSRLKSVKFPFALCSMRISPQWKIYNENNNWFPLLQMKITLSIQSFNRQYKKSVSNCLVWQGFDLTLMNGSQSFLFYIYNAVWEIWALLLKAHYAFYLEDGSVILRGCYCHKH